MLILVTGGGGFLGSGICDRLLRDGHALRVFERPRVQPYREFQAPEKVEWFTGDFTSRHDVGQSLEGVDAVIHLVSTTLPKNSNEDPIYDLQSNVVATLQLLEEMKKKSIRKVIFISSGGTVYGIPEILPIPETHQTNPICSYGITKLAIEKYLHLYRRLHGFQPIILRVANPYGPRQRPDTAQGAVAAFLHRVRTGQAIHIWGDGSVVRDYLHIDDVAEAFLAALHYTGGETVFNIGAGVGTTLKQLVETIESVSCTNLEVEYQVARTFDVPANVLCIEKAREHLQWEPATGLAQGIAQTLEQIPTCRA
jgi:UDP-glucose 4-epimerase